MRTELKDFAKRWAISTVAVLVAARILPGIHYRHWSDLLAATLLLGILNTVVRPLLLVLSLPLLIFTLGLFTLLINAGMLYLVHLLLPGFQVDGFWSAFFGALIISIVSLFLNTLAGSRHSRIQVHRGKRPPPRPPEDDGPVIDV